MRILIVDDHAALREPLAFMIAREPAFEVIAEVGSLGDAQPYLATCEVAVVDYALPDGTGADLIRRLREANPSAEALLLTASTDRLDLARAVDAGAAGVLHKSACIRQIVDALRRLSAGESLLSRAELVDLVRLASHARIEDQAAQIVGGYLTPRERDVLRALVDGLTDKEIAQQLAVSPETVRTHLTSVMGKLGATSRLQALVMAIRTGIVQIT